MSERPIYSTKPDKEPELTPLTLGQVGCLTLVVDGVFGGVSGVIWGPQAGIEVAIGMTGFMGGVMLGVTSWERAERFAKEGRGKRAYLEALRGSFETAFGLALAGATTGQAIAEVPGALIGGGFGALVGIGGFGQFAFATISRELRSRKATTE